ncbi:MAG: haloacid dehalogenase-like hydrolase [Candidatus Eisenbacteria bacterium]|nr:haloacid dehalogenase-like hydrolase [Candidatus Eisenbacteria bacterium]
MKILLFDIDGTILTGGAGSRSLGIAFREVFKLDGDHLAMAMKRVAFNGRTDPAIVRDVAREAGVSDNDFEAGLERLYETYLRHLDRRSLEPGPRLCPGIPQLLDRLEAIPGIGLGLLTGNIEPGARIKLRAFDLNRYFPVGGFGSDSPDRGVIAAMARQRFEVLLGRSIDPGQVLVIGDTVHDIACGRVNGFRTLGVGTGGVPLAAMAEAGADLTRADLADVDEIIKQVEQLLTTD